MSDAAVTFFVDMNDGPRSCTKPPPQEALSASSTQFLVLAESEDADEILIAIGELGLRARRYRVIPVLEVEATEADVPRLTQLAGVVEVFPAMALVDKSRTYANGIDILLNVAKVQNRGTTEYGYRGRASGDPLGYPVLKPGRKVHPDDDLDWPAQPALMPVLNLSVGPGSPDYPTAMNDIVTIATNAASVVGTLVVIAAGNCGSHGPGSMSAWANPPWVLAVGATEDKEGTTLASYSAKGHPDEPASGPDLVAFGQSSIPPYPVGTSFAAPRVTFLVRFVVAALCQLSREVLVQQGSAPVGVPLVGYGTVDRFGAEIWYEPKKLLSLQALPIVGVNPAAVEACLRVVTTIGRTVEVRADSEIVRSLLLDAARPMPGYARHEVGAGFVDYDLILDQLAAMDGMELVRLFTSGEGDLPESAIHELQQCQVFDRAQLDDLGVLIEYTGPVWMYDYPGQRFAARPIDPDELQARPANERTLGLPAPPLPLSTRPAPPLG